MFYFQQGVCRTLSCELQRLTLCSTALLAEIIVVCEENKDSNYAHPLISPISSSRLHQHQHTSSLLCSVNRIQSHCWAVNLPSINLGPIQRLLDTNTRVLGLGRGKGYAVYSQARGHGPPLCRTLEEISQYSLLTFCGRPRYSSSSGPLLRTRTKTPEIDE